MKTKKFKVLWQSVIHKSIQSEVFESDEKAYSFVTSLINNSKMLNIDWIDKPVIKEIYDNEQQAWYFLLDFKNI